MQEVVYGFYSINVYLYISQYLIFKFILLRTQIADLQTQFADKSKFEYLNI